jgi:hypothetical protein
MTATPTPTGHATANLVPVPFNPRSANMTEPSIHDRLSEPFPAEEHKWKVQAVKGNRALAVAYVDARAIMDRLDSVFGEGGWQDRYEALPIGGVVCTLRVKVGAEWIEKSDVGSLSEQPDEGDRLKAAFSDALKRAAVKLGIGRYLYRLQPQWVEYDPKTRQFKSAPKLALEKPARGAKPAKPAPTGAPKQPETPQCITGKQWADLKGEITARGLSQKAVLCFYQVVKPSEFPLNRYSDALRRVQAAFAAFKVPA